MTTPAVSQVFLCSTALCWIQSDDLSHAKSPEISTVLELPSFSTGPVYIRILQFSRCWKRHTEAVNSSDIDRCDWKLLLFES